MPAPLVPFHTLRRPQGHGLQRRPPGVERRHARAARRRQRRRRRDRHQRRARRDHPAHVRDGRRPVRARPPRRRPRPDCLNASGRAGSGADADGACAPRGTGRMPTDEDIRAVTVPGLRRRLAEPARAPRSPTDRPRCSNRPGALAEDGFPASPILAFMVPLISHVDGADDYTRERGPHRHADPPARCRSHPGGHRRRRPRRLLRGRVRGRPAPHRRRALRGRRPGHGPGRLGRPARHRPLGPPRLDRPAEQPGLPQPGRRPHRRAHRARARSSDAEPDSAEWAHLLVEAARLAGHDRPDVLHDAADGDALLADDAARARARSGSRPQPAPTSTPRSTTATPSTCAPPTATAWACRSSSPTHAAGASTSPFPRSASSCTTAGRASRWSPGIRPSSRRADARPTPSHRHWCNAATARLRAVLGTMGGDSQPQVVLQLLARLLVAGQSPAACIGAPRWRLGSGGFDVWDHGRPGHRRRRSQRPRRLGRRPAPAWPRGRGPRRVELGLRPRPPDRT